MKILITPARQMLDAIILQKKSAAGVGGITLLEKRKRKDRINGMNCLRYLFRESPIPQFRVVGEGRNAVALSVGGFAEVETPMENDLAIYITDYELGMKEQAHVGRFFPDGRVVSKWGYGHVYQHDVDCVPTWYGQEVRFFRRSG
jgi:hypothetical protein